VAEVVQRAGDKAEGRAAVADAAVAVVEAVVNKTTVRADDVVAALAAGHDEGTAPIRNLSRTVTFRPNRGKDCSNFTPTDTAFSAAPKTITPANAAIRSCPER
jgi:hypothetical protein